MAFDPIQILISAKDEASAAFARVRDAVSVVTDAIKSKLDLESSEVAMQRKKLDGAQAEQQALLQIATARGDEMAAAQAREALRNIEAQKLELVARAKSAEAAALEKTAAALREELAAAGPLTQQQQQRLQVAENAAKAMALEAQTARQSAQSVLALGQAQDQATASARAHAAAQERAAALAEAAKRASEEKAAAIKRTLEVERSEIELQSRHLEAARAVNQSALQAAKARGDEAAALQAANALRQNEADQLALLARAKRAEATAIQQAVAARREELAAIGPLTQAHASELRAAENQAESLRVQAAAADQAAGRARDMGAAVQQAGQQSQQSAQGVGVLGEAARAAGAAMAAAFTLREMVAAAAGMETLQAGLKAITGDSAKAAQELEFVRVVASRVGGDVLEVGRAYLGLAASTKGTAVEGQATRDVFEAVSNAMGKAGRSSAETSNALMALSQMASKGTVQAEELKGQLGEALPGALQAAAAGMGITVEEMNKLVESGSITANDIFPALTKGLNELYGQAGGAQTLAQEFANIKNAFSDMSARLGDSGGLNAFKVAAELAQMAILLFGEGLVAAGQKIGVLMGALATLDFSRVREEFASIEKASQTSILKAAQHNDTLRASLELLNPELGKTNGAAAAAAAGIAQAGSAAQAAGTQAAASAGDWTRLQVRYGKVLASVQESIALAQKSVAAREAEGKAAMDLATAFGTEGQQRAAAASTAQASAQALEQLAQARQTELDALNGQLIALEQEGAAGVKMDDARKKQLESLRTLIAERTQETQKARAQADASAVVAAKAAAEAQAHKDNGGRVRELGDAYAMAESKVLQLRAAQEQGRATAQQVAQAEREAGAALLLYRDALSDSIQATRADTALKRSAIGVRQSALQLAIAEKQTAYEIAKAQGDEAGAAQALLEIKRLEAKQAMLAAQAKRVEAEGALSLAEAKKAELASLGLLTPVKQAEIDASINSAQAMLNQAKAAEELAKKLERLAGLRGGGGGGGGAGETLQNVGDSADKAGDSLKGMGDKAEKAGQQTTAAAKEASQSADSLVSMWWRGENGASKYAQAVNKAMWETVRFHPQTEAGFAAMSAQANKMIETLEGIDAAQQKLQQSAQGSDAALADMRLRLLEIDGTEEEIAAAKMERERNAIAIEIKRLELEMERARVWKDRAQMDALNEEIAKQKELLNLLGQVEEKEKRKRNEETAKKKAQEEDRRKRDEEAAKQRAEDERQRSQGVAKQKAEENERKRSQDADKQKTSDRSEAYLGEDPGKSRSPTAPASSGGGLGTGGGASYVSNITIDGRRRTVGYADRESQMAGEALIRELATARGVAQ